MAAVPSAESTPARPRFFARTALAMAAIVLLSFPLMYCVPVIAGTRDFHVLHHVHGAACLLLAPVQVSGAWIARSEWWNGIAPSVLAAAPG